MKLLITGALGHIGSKLIRDLPQKIKVDEIVLVDNMSAQRYCSLFDLPSITKYSFVEGDVRTIDLQNIFSKGIDAVIHLAAITNAAESFDFKEALEKNNFGATEKIAISCAESKVPLMFASTTSVYGTAQSIVDENCSKEELKPQSPYAETKLREEALLNLLGQERGLNYVICRFGTIYGTSVGMRFHTAVNKFCWQACLGQPITVWKTALYQKRPYLDINDAVRAVEHIITKKLYNRTIYNVLTNNLTVSDIVEEIKKNVQSLKVELVDSKIMNQLSYEVSCEKFSGTGFKSTGSIAGQISATVRLLKGSSLGR
jgi:UDP-glucose 4-epimerase